MNELINIKVIQKEFNGEKKRFVNARELHAWLKVGKRFASWITERIEKYGFTENLDYFITIPNFGNGLSAQSKGKIVDAKTGKVLPKNYILSVDMAKELAMVENSEIGKQEYKGTLYEGTHKYKVVGIEGRVAPTVQASDASNESSGANRVKSVAKTVGKAAVVGAGVGAVATGAHYVPGMAYTPTGRTETDFA